MQKLRGMDGPEAAAWAMAETDRAGLASRLIMNRMWCYAHQESERRSINSALSGVSYEEGPVFHASDKTLPLWDRFKPPGPHLNHPRQDHGAACQDPGILPAPAPGPGPDQVELAKCRRALAAAKRALEDNAPLEPSSPEYFWASARARAAAALAEISKALEGGEL